jgi:uncharacterized glyoxalase superfamily protein PhnB
MEGPAFGDVRSAVALSASAVGFAFSVGFIPRPAPSWAAETLYKRPMLAASQVKDIVPIFFVVDVRRSLEWYQRLLGFRTAFAHGDPIQYAGVELGPIRIHLAAFERSLKGACYLRLHSGLDEYVREIASRGHPILVAAKDQPYGMREATVRDPDGNDIYIGQPIP